MNDTDAASLVGSTGLRSETGDAPLVPGPEKLSLLVDFTNTSSLVLGVVS